MKNVNKWRKRLKDERKSEFVCVRERELEKKEREREREREGGGLGGI